MKHRVKFEVVFESSCVGFGDCDGMTDIELLKMLVEEEGLFGIIDIGNEEFANGITSVELVEE